MNTVEDLESEGAVGGLLDLIQAREPILDTTYGNGTFWKSSTRRVVGSDIALDRARDVAADFSCLPFRDDSFSTVIFDPPFHPYVNSAEEVWYKGMGSNERELKASFERGIRECWRVSSRHLLVKCQGFIHNHAPQWMPLWAIQICGEPFEWLVVRRGHKRISGRWVTTRSLRRNHADYLIFDKRGNHR